MNIRLKHNMVICSD